MPTKEEKMDPKPIPLRIAVTKGNQKNVVTIPIYGRDDRNFQYILYPKKAGHHS